MENKKFRICRVGETIYYLPALRPWEKSKEMRMRAHKIGSEYGGCFHINTWKFIYKGEILAVSNVKRVSASEATFDITDINGKLINGRVKTAASQYGGYYIDSIFGTSAYSMTTSSNSVVGKETIDYVFTFSDKLAIDELSWNNYTTIGRSITDLSLFFDGVEYYRTPESKRGVYSKTTTIKLVKNGEGML